MNDNNTVSEKDSILLSTKKLVMAGGESETEFDTDLIIHINTVLANLVQMGVGPQEGYEITGSSDVWSDFIGTDDAKKLNQVKTYVYLKVRMIFDPPSNQTLANAYEKNISELEYRLYTEKGGY